MGLGHTFLRRLIARTASKHDWSQPKTSEGSSCGSLLMGTALGTAGVVMCAPSFALLDSQDSNGTGEEHIKERFPNAFSRKGKGSGQQEPYMAYNRDGQRVPLADIVQRVKDADVVLLGETHDDSIAHQLQLQLMLGALKQVRRAGRQLTLSLEMFERDVQGVMDEYLAGSITERDLRQDARPWPNYDTDYRPMVQVAKHEGLPVICANAPRRYVSLAGRSGRAALEQLPQESRQWLPPLPYKQPSQAYIQKTNWTMQQAKDELDAARKQDDEQSANSTDTDTETAPESPSAGVEEGQCPAFSRSVSTGSRDAPSISVPALSSSYAGNALPMLGQDVSSSERAHKASKHADPAEQQRNNIVQPKAQAGARGDGAGAVEQPDKAEAAAAESAGCPYIGLTMSSNFLDAQCLWDATMAYSIAKGLGKPLHPSEESSSLPKQSSASSVSAEYDASMAPEAAPAGSSSEAGAALRGSPLVLHVCGKFHSEGWMGIYEHIHAYHAANAKRQGSSARRLDVVIVTFLPSSRDLALTSDEFREERLAAYGDYVILTDFNRPRSFEIGHVL